MTRFYRLISLFALILVLRLGVALLIDMTFEVSKDAEDVYASIAENLTRGNGFVAEPGGEPILHRAPLYPLFLAGVYTIFGATNSFAVLCTQALLDAGSGLLLWWIGVRLFGATIGVIAALLYALYPLSAYYTLRLTTESLFTLVLLTVIVVLIRAMSSGKSQSVPFGWDTWSDGGLGEACDGGVGSVSGIFCYWSGQGSRWPPPFPKSVVSWQRSHWGSSRGLSGTMRQPGI